MKTVRLYNNAKGILPLVTLLHAATNTTAVFRAVTSDLSAQIIETLIWVMVAIAVIFVAGLRQLSQTKQKQVQTENLKEIQRIRAKFVYRW